MSFTWAFRIFLLCVLSYLTGCGSSGSSETTMQDPVPDDPSDPGGGDPPAQSLLNIVSPEQSAAYYTTLLGDFAQVVDASNDGSITAFASLPTSGSVSYSGYMQLIVGNQTVSANVIGEAELTHTLATGVMAGHADGFLGVAEDEFGFDQVAAYEGTILLANGVVADGGGGATAAAIDIAGALDNGLTTLDVTGSLVGALYGAGADGIHMIGSNTGIHGDVDVVIDGVSSSLTIAVATVSVLRD